ncbi:MAG: hypothetical protein WKG01_11575 [Kofleriaceae bacterium]
MDGRPEQPRFARGTDERGKTEVQSMIAAAAALPAPLIYGHRPKPAGERPRAPRPEPPMPTGAGRQPAAAAAAPPPQPLLIAEVQRARPVSQHLGLTAERESAIAIALDTPVGVGETIDAFNRRKERSLGEAFAQLSVSEARILHKRLSMPELGDPIAARFARMITERRNRLLVFLADARRREAIHTVRR